MLFMGLRAFMALCITTGVIAPANEPQLVRAELHKVLTLEHHMARLIAAGGESLRDGEEQGGLAAAGFADDAEKFPGDPRSGSTASTALEHPPRR